MISITPTAIFDCHSSPPLAPAWCLAVSRREPLTRAHLLGSWGSARRRPLQKRRDPRRARQCERGKCSQSHGGPGRPHWLRPGQSRRSLAAVGPRAAAPAPARSPCYALSNSPRYRVMCCCSRRRRCRRPWCPGSSAALRGGSRGRGRGSRVQGAARLRRFGASRCSHRPPQVMPPPPVSA